jgi:hypothetical protein
LVRAEFAAALFLLDANMPLPLTFILYFIQGFAVGSQKLLLNIRHEMKHRQDSPRSLGIALSVLGSVYVGICLLAGKSK